VDFAVVPVEGLRVGRGLVEREEAGRHRTALW
jgi:hypothetical protein